jgi:hypothetical protein
MTVNIIGINAKQREGDGVINTTSRSSNWSVGLSPFIIGPIDLYKNAPCKQAIRFENLWQFSKCYWRYNSNGEPNSLYYDWAKKGFEDYKPIRYPMGKGAKPEYSWWNGERLSYIEARKKIYIPYYAQSVSKTNAWLKLKEEYKSRGNQITLWDFDGYNYLDLNMSFDDVINFEGASMGHSFVLAMMLEGYIKY